MKSITITISVLLLLSCNNNNQKIPNSVQKKKVLTNESKSQINIDEKIKKNDKLFLDFWLYMSQDEYLQVRNKLKSENIISKQDTYTIEGKDLICTFTMQPSFRNDSLISITLTSIPDEDPWRVCEFLQKYKYDVNAADNISVPDKICSFEIKDITRLFSKKYQNPDIIKPFTYNDDKVYRWVLSKKIIDIKPTYYNFYIPGRVGQRVVRKDLGTALQSVEILYLDIKTFQKEQFERRKTIEDEDLLRRNKINRTLKDI